MKVKEKLSPVSKAFDLKRRSTSASAWGISSSLVHVTVVPTAISAVSGVKVKLSILTTVSAATSGDAPVKPSAKAAANAIAARAGRALMKAVDMVSLVRMRCGWAPPGRPGGGSFDGPGCASTGERLVDDGKTLRAGLEGHETSAGIGQVSRNGVGESQSIHSRHLAPRACCARNRHA